MEQSSFAWRNPGSDEVIEVDWERDEKLREIVKLITIEARLENDRDKRLQRLAGALRDDGFTDSIDLDFAARLRGAH